MRPCDVKQYYYKLRIEKKFWIGAHLWEEFAQRNQTPIIIRVEKIAFPSKPD